jgi:hypothetical protein
VLVVVDDFGDDKQSDYLGDDKGGEKAHTRFIPFSCL